MKEFANYEQAKDLLPIGTKDRQMCYDGKVHEVTVLDYLVKLYGNTYHNRNLMHELDFMWHGDNKYWYKDVESDEELEKIFKAIEGKGIRLYAKSIFRITDLH